jgi:hypothetical protein
MPRPIGECHPAMMPPERPWRSPRAAAPAVPAQPTLTAAYEAEKSAPFAGHRYLVGYVAARGR